MYIELHLYKSVLTHLISTYSSQKKKNSIDYFSM